MAGRVCKESSSNIGCNEDHLKKEAEVANRAQVVSALRVNIGSETGRLYVSMIISPFVISKTLFENF